MKRVVTVVEVFALVCFGVFVLLLFTKEAAKPAVASKPSTSSGAAPAPGAALYASHCSGCHGDSGQGAVGPALGGGAVTSSFPNPSDEVKFVVTGGGGMPSFGSSLSAEEIKQIVDFTRNGL